MISEEKLGEILRFHKSIRFVYLIGKDGELIGYRTKMGTKGMAPDRVMEQVYAKAAIGTKMADPEVAYHGRSTSFIMNKEKVRVIGFPGNEGTVLVSTDLGFPLAAVELLGQLVESLENASTGKPGKAVAPSATTAGSQ